MLESQFRKDIKQFLFNNYKHKKHPLFELFRNPIIKQQRLDHYEQIKDFVSRTDTIQLDWVLAQLIKHLCSIALAGKGGESTLFNALMNYVNRFHGELNYGYHFQSLHAETQEDVLEAILPIDIQEKKLAREVEILHSQIILISMHKDKSIDFLNNEYKKNLISLQKGFSESYYELLKAREQIYYHGSLIDTKDILPALMKEFNETLDKEMQRYEQFEFKQSADLEPLKITLKKLMDEKLDEVTDLYELKKNFANRFHAAHRSRK